LGLAAASTVFTRCSLQSRFPTLNSVYPVQLQESNVKRLIAWMGLSVILLFGMAFAQDSAKQDMKDAGHEAKQAAKDTGHATKTTSKKAGHNVKKGTHKAAKKVEEKTQ
jgi:hypothetical protein